MAEQQEKADEEARQRQVRCFHTTNGMTHDQKDLTSNVVGRKVMCTQDGKLVPMAHRDE